MGKGLTSGDSNLLLDEFTPHHFFSDWVLNLNASVHLHEVEVLGFLIDQVFDRSCIFVANRRDQLHRCLSHLLTKFFRNEWRRTFLNDFLITALHGAITLTELDKVPVGVTDYLDFNVMRFKH